MYIIYCKHIFVYIFLCYFNWDSSFVTEVFSSSPLQTEALCFSSFSVRHSRHKRLFLLICTENKNQEGRWSWTLMFWSFTSHFDDFTSQLRAQETTSTSWLVIFQNGSESGQIEKLHKFTSCWLKFPEHGSSWWKNKESNQGLRSWGGCWSFSELKRRWQCEKSYDQYPDQVLFFLLWVFFFICNALTFSMSTWCQQSCFVSFHTTGCSHCKLLLSSRWILKQITLKWS